MLRWDCTCFVCLKNDFTNDVHHVFYAKEWGKTRVYQTRVLCRMCHNNVHRRMKQIPARPRKDGTVREKQYHAQFTEIVDEILKESEVWVTARERYDLFAHRDPTRKRNKIACEVVIH